MSPNFCPNPQGTAPLICFHDDDAGSELALEWLDVKSGKRLREYTTERDVLAVKFAPDGRTLALSTNRGGVVILSPEGRLIREIQLEGEVIDFAIGLGESPPVAILYRSKTYELYIDSKEKPPQRIQLSEKATSVAISPRGDRVSTYSNLKSGQWVRWRGPGTEAGEHLLSPKQAEYNGLLVSFDNWVLVGVDNSRLAAILDAEKLWEIPIQTEEGAMLYALAQTTEGKVSDQDGALVKGSLLVATDDGKLQLWNWFPAQLPN